MNYAVLFPGQGSQAVGMGKELADAFPAAKAVFDEVDAALGEKLSDLIKKSRKAHYSLLNIDAPGPVIHEIERRHRINEDVLRFLTVKVEELSAEPSPVIARKDRDDRKRDRDDFGGGGGFSGGGFRGGDDRPPRGDRPPREDRGDRPPRPPRDR